MKIGDKIIFKHSLNKKSKTTINKHAIFLRYYDNYDDVNNALIFILGNLGASKVKKSEIYIEK